MSDSQSSSGTPALRQIAEELREFTAMKYAGNCKCGKCQLVPRALVERIYHTLNGAAIQRREAPEGYVIMPREATRVMTMAGCDSLPSCEHVFGHAGEMLKNAYAKMVEVCGHPPHPASVAQAAPDRGALINEIAARSPGVPKATIRTLLEADDASPPAALPAGEAAAQGCGQSGFYTDPNGIEWLCVEQDGKVSVAQADRCTTITLDLFRQWTWSPSAPSTTREIPAVDPAIECWSIVEQLRANEGAEVILLCDNPDFNGQPNNVIEICDDWTRWTQIRFTGDTMLDCLRKALRARTEDAAVKAQERKDEGR